MIPEIRSGGQTGVDRAALDTAIALNIPHGGWCPKGRLAEDGPLHAKYQLKETETAHYAERTKRNIRDSDATLVMVNGDLTKLTDGTTLTIDTARKINKPYLIFDLDSEGNVERVTGWIRASKFKTLNIAGPRESNAPGIYQQSRIFLMKMLVLLMPERFSLK